MPSPGGKAQPWKTVWPPTDTRNVCNTKVDYGAKQGDIVILDGSGFMLKPFDAYSKPILKKFTDTIMKPTQQ
jgi:hypothetical protein